MRKHFNELPIKWPQSDEMCQFVKELKQYSLDEAFLKIGYKNFTVKYTGFIGSTVCFLVESLAKVTTFWNNE